MNIAGWAAMAVLAPVAATDGSTIMTRSGPIVGTRETGTFVYRGIPYAAPPVGDLRWRAPVPAARWVAPRRAANFGPICPQPVDINDVGVGREPQSEDCLTLNIWTPSVTTSHALPVMVWLHGGGYVTGSGSAQIYDGARLARRGVIVVTLNYRLGRLGFFAHPELGRATNFGLLDQLAALRWVRSNIGRFGGDPHRITLFGNSAGGEAILLLMTSSSSEGMFQRAIVQSGLGGRSLPTLTAAQAEGSDFARSVGAGSLTALRRLPASAIVADHPSTYRGFGPVIDGSLISTSIEQAFRDGQEYPIPLIIGTNSNELPTRIMGGPSRIDAFMRWSPAERDRWRMAYSSAQDFETFIAGDVLFRAPALRLAAARAQRSRPTFTYLFDVKSTGARWGLQGAPHAAERAFVFDNLDRIERKPQAGVQALASEMADRWTFFAMGLSPAPSWPQFIPSDPAELRITETGSVVETARLPESHPFVRSLLMSDNEPLRIVAVGAHPDDIEISMAGLLLLFADAGHEVTWIVATDGAAGEGAAGVDLARLRGDEARAAAAAAGARLMMLDFPDGRLARCLDAVERVAAALTAARASLIITHAPTDYHPDHRALARMVLDTAPLGTPILHAENMLGVASEPAFLVDVSAVFDRKLELLKHHATQRPEVFAEGLRAWNRFRGIQAGLGQWTYAEGYSRPKRLTADPFAMLARVGDVRHLP